MRLHKLFNNFELPYCLKRKLEFGNLQQIFALRDLEDRIRKMEERKNLPEKTFKFNIRFDGSMEGTVVARTEEEAEEKAEKNFDNKCYDFNELDITNIHIIEIKKQY